MLETISVCPICQGNSFNSFLTVKDHTVTQQNFHLVSCATCGFLLTNPRPPLDEIHNFYKSEKYISHTGGSGSLMDRLYRFARGYTLKWKQKLITAYAQEKTLLDYGCGTGSFLAHMKTNAWNVTGVEPSAEARAKASEGAIVHEHIESVNGTYSIITLWHVLEHIHDLNKILTELAQRLQASGTIFIAVPNYKSADAIHYKNNWAAYDVPRHLWHFNRQTMTKALANAGFNVQKIVPMKLDAYYVCLLSESYKNPKASTLTRYFHALQQAWISNCAARSTGEYSSLIYIAKKS